jgi:hypothetical protein
MKLDFFLLILEDFLLIIKIQVSTRERETGGKGDRRGTTRINVIKI